MTQTAPHAAPPILNLVPTPEAMLIRETVARIANDFGQKAFAAAVDEGRAPEALWSALAQGGFCGVNLPEEYGGGGLGVAALADVVEELAAAGCPMLGLVIAGGVGGSILANHGTAEQKQAWLPRIADGSLQIAMAMTEPDAGGNPDNIKTTATRDGDTFVIRGTKTYISNIDASELILVVARSGTDERTGRVRLTLLVVDRDSAGLTRQHVPVALRIPEKQSTVFFDDVVVPADRLVGQEHGGFRAMWDGLNPERILAASLSIGIGRYALAKAARYVNERNVWGVPIGAHQAVAHPLAEARINLELARLMNEKAAALFDAGLPAADAAGMAKLSAADAGVQCLDQAIQAHGGNGLANEYGLTDMWWLARLQRIAPVSRELLLNFTAEHMLGLPKSY